MRSSCAPSSLRNSLVIIASAIAPSCDEPARIGQTNAAQQCDAPEVRDIVQRLGQRMKQVSLQAPDSIVVREIRAAYEPLVTSNLLQMWVSDPASAPGRQVSSPWPDRVEIISVEPAQATLCRVEGELIYRTSAEDSQREAMLRERMTFWVSREDGWRISAYEPESIPRSDSITEPRP